MKKNILIKTHSIVTLLITLLICSSSVQGQQAAGLDTYKIQSEQAITMLKYRNGQTAEQETALRKIHAYYYQQRTAILKSTEASEAQLERISALRNEYEKQLEALFGKERYTVYTQERNGIATRLALYQAGKEKIATDNSKMLSARESGIMKERYALKPQQIQALALVNDAYYLQMDELSKQEKDLAQRKKKREEVRQDHEKQLQSVFSKEQYTAYRKDIDAINAEAQKQQKARDKAFQEKIERFKADTGLLHRTEQKNATEKKPIKE